MKKTIQTGTALLIVAVIISSVIGLQSCNMGTKKLDHNDSLNIAKHFKADDCGTLVLQTANYSIYKTGFPAQPGATIEIGSPTKPKTALYYKDLFDPTKPNSGFEDDYDNDDELAVGITFGGDKLIDYLVNAGANIPDAQKDDWNIMVDFIYHEEKKKNAVVFYPTDKNHVIIKQQKDGKNMMAYDHGSICPDCN